MDSLLLSDRSLTAKPFLEVLSRGGRGRVAERARGKGLAHLPPGRDAKGKAMLAVRGRPGAAQLGERLHLRPGDVGEATGGAGERRVGEARGDDAGIDGLHLDGAGRADAEVGGGGKGRVKELGELRGAQEG